MTNGERIINQIIIDNGPRSIAFCPYLREMWDSMESVYTAAVEKGLNASVCYIPYFTRDVYWNVDRWNTDPNDFKVPDAEIIVTHNPFDACNMITGLHPAFYSDNLKRRGKTIVYIPYYTGRTVPATLRLPVIINADYIFVNDEEDRNAFLSVYPNKKVYAYGSPKKDAIRGKTHGHRTILCASLMPVVKDPAGRIELYKKIIAEHDGILFRPHPLTEAGIKAMNQGKVEEWQQFIKSVKDLDTEPDLEKSLERCDRLITDSLSIKDLWEETGLAYEWI